MTPALAAIALYTGLLALIGLWLAINTGKKKERAGISIGDGGDPLVIRAQRGQMNFIENTPIALLILLVASLIGTPVFVIHIAGLTLVIGRFLHACHFSRDTAPRWQRAAGMMLTLAVIFFGSLGLIGHALYSMF